MNEQPGDYWPKIIEDNLNGNIDLQDKKKLEEWLELSEENREQYRKHKELWLAVNLVKEARKYDHIKAYRNFQKRITEPEKKKRKSINFFRYVAAVLPLAILTAYFCYSYFSMKEISETMSLKTIVVPKGSTSRVLFRDGSNLWINSESEVELVPSVKSERRIDLKGEAFFEVARNEDLPFIVRAKEVEVKVLGTTFNVNAYADDDEIKISLESGSVELVLAEGGGLLLKPSEQAVCNLKTKEIIVREIDIRQVTAWKLDQLIFTGESFDVIIKILEKKFNITIDVEKPGLASARFSGDFTKGETIDQILKIMSAKNRFRYSMGESRVRIY